MPEGLMSSPSGGPKGSNQLPRDKVSLSFPPAPRLAPTGFRPGLVTGMAVVVCFHLVRGTSATARSRNVSGSSAAGRRPNANVSCGFKRRRSNSTPRRNASVVVASVRRRRQAWTWLRLHSSFRSTARGHAAKKILTIFAIVRAATLRFPVLGVVPLSTAAEIAVRPNVACRIGSASSRPA